MSKLELKLDLHKILDQIENEQLLRTIYDFIKQKSLTKEATIWNSLSEEQKNEVYQSYQESNDPKQLSSWNSIKKKY
jgi:hypothetical protein